MKTAMRTIILGFVIVLVAAGFWFQQQISPTGAANYTLDVKTGMSSTAVLNQLQQAGIIRNAELVNLLWRNRGTRDQLREGRYPLSGQLNANQVLDILERPGQPRVVRVTIPEGKRLTDIIDILDAAGLGGSRAQLETAFKNTQLNSYAQGSLEGWLFPATYLLQPETSAADIVRTLSERMQQELTAQRIADAKKLGLSVEDWVTLASMVQAEAGNTTEMPAIAGVFLNRLDIGMRLQSDPTIAYGLGLPMNQLNRRLGHFKQDTPYNSYMRAGLPPTPINNPGQAALLAVLSPVRMAGKQTAIYFLHGLNGKLYLNHNFDDHQHDVARYR